MASTGTRSPRAAGRLGFATFIGLACLGAITACEDVTIPTEPAGAPEFPIVQVDVSLPAPGTALSQGAGPQDYRVSVLYQRTSADQAAGPWPVFAWIETWDQLGSTGNLVWEGDLAFGRRAIRGDKGEVVVEGSFSLPTISPFCGSIDEVHAFVVVAGPEDTDTVAVIPSSELSDKENLSEYVGVEVYDVANASSPSGPCVIFLESYVYLNRFEFQWGEPVWIWGRRLPSNDKPVLGFGGGAEIDFALSLPGDSTFGGSWDLVSSWVPPLARSGAIQVSYGGLQTEYGAQRAPFIRVNDAAGDFFEPNDSWQSPSDDPLGSFWGDDIGWVINPALTMDLADREIDATGNPGGLDVWGKGDWWHLSVPGETCVEVVLDQQALDDLDLFLLDGTGNVLAFNGFGFGSVEILVKDSTTISATARTDRLIWVAPGSGGVSSAEGAYELYAVNCELLAGASPGELTVASGAPLAVAERGRTLSRDDLLRSEAEAGREVGMVASEAPRHGRTLLRAIGPGSTADRAPRIRLREGLEPLMRAGRPASATLREIPGRVARSPTRRPRRR